MDSEREEVLLIDEELQPILIENECEELKPIIEDFVEDYAENQDKPLDEWLSRKLQENLPEKSMEEINEMTEEIITTIQTDQKNKSSLEEALQNGRSKESWLASTAKKMVAAGKVQQSVQYLNQLDSALKNANEALYNTITTQAGTISQNPSLDGFIAEQYHAQTFNMNAEAAGSSYRAKVLEPNGTGYAKNSVDIVIVDANGKIVKRYQAKYCKDANATQKAFEAGDYRGQQKLVPEGQEGEIAKKTTTVLEAPDGTTSNPLTKTRAEQMRDEAQSGKWSDLNWNEYKTKDLAVGIGKQAGYAALQGAAIGVGIEVAQKLWNGEEIKAQDVVKTAVTSGADIGVKAALSGAIKVGAEKEIIKVIPKGTPAGAIANVVFVGVEDAKIMAKIATGELSIREGVEKIEETTVATVGGIVAGAKGTEIGAAIGMTFGPVGAAIGGFVGGTVGFMAGSKAGELVVKGARKICRKIKTAIVDARENIVNTAQEIKSSISNGVCNLVSGMLGILGL